MKEIDFGDEIETPYGKMVVVDIEIGRFEEGGWIQTRMVEEDE